MTPVAAASELLAELRANGVEHVERDGRTFTFLRLGEAELDRGRVDRMPIVPRSRRAVALA